jgi:hypothetical protein
MLLFVPQRASYSIKSDVAIAGAHAGPYSPGRLRASLGGRECFLMARIVGICERD